MSQNLPIRIARPIFRPVYRQCRVARTPVRHASTTGAVEQQPGRADRGKAPSTVRAEAQENMEALMDDIGLLPQTFIRAIGAAPTFLPRPISPISKDRYLQALGDRWMYEKTYVKTKVQDLYQMLYYKWWVRRGPIKTKPKQVFYHKNVRKVAQEYYEKIYEAFASGNQAEFQKFCLSGLQTHFKERLDSRPEGITMSWKLLRRDWFPRVVSNRFTVFPIPGADDRDAPTAIRQVVLRMKTRQLLTIQQKTAAKTDARDRRKKPLAWSPDGVQLEAEEDKPVVSETHEKDVIEYIVMQQRMMRGRLEPWAVWGFGEKTTLKLIRDDQKAVEQTQEYDQANPGLM